MKTSIRLKHKIIYLIIISGITFSVFAQEILKDKPTIYNVTPGIKGNEIIITLSNISTTDIAENIEVKRRTLSMPKEELKNIIFDKESQIIEKLNPKEEKEVTFRFDVRREAPVNTKDTIEFIIIGKGILTTKKFVLNYIAPNEYRLEQNYPNPFNSITTIQYQLPYDSKVSLKIYNILGEEVGELVDEVQSTGFKEIRFDTGNSLQVRTSLASGIYIYRLIAIPQDRSGAGTFSFTKKMMLLK